MAHSAHTSRGVFDLVEKFVVTPVAGFLNALYEAATTDFDTQKIASKSNFELSDMGLRRDHLALVVRPSHLNL